MLVTPELSRNSTLTSSYITQRKIVLASSKNALRAHSLNRTLSTTPTLSHGIVSGSSVTPQQRSKSQSAEPFPGLVSDDNPCVRNIEPQPLETDTTRESHRNNTKDRLGHVTQSQTTTLCTTKASR